MEHTAAWMQMCIAFDHTDVSQAGKLHISPMKFLFVGHCLKNHI